MASSTTLYRKWRPQTFDELKGQDLIRDTLLYALTHEQVSHAYLFCGPRGTGKTTTARLIAKIINCTSEKNKPCNTCDSCKTITDGTNLDVIELDAASNRGIEEIRQLRETVRFAPTQAKYKVFIIDEVHMLTREAFNALLKTLEEPPSHTLFILATTESHKIPPTITSRCQRYDFRLASPEALAEHLIAVAGHEGMKLDSDGAAFIARLADGSFRDALSLLEQVKSRQETDYSRVALEKMFGFVSRDEVADTLAAILAGDIVLAHQNIDVALARGADLRAFCDQMLSMSQEVIEGLALRRFDDMPNRLSETAQSLGLNACVRWVELLLQATSQMKVSPIPRLLLDVAIAKFHNEESEINNQGGGTKVNAAPPVVSVTKPKDVAAAAPPIVEAAPKIEKTEPISDVTQPEAESETVSVPVIGEVPEVLSPQTWQQVLAALKVDTPSLVTSLSHARVNGLVGDEIEVAVKFKMHAEKINQPKHRQKIETVLTEVLGEPRTIRAVVVKDLDLDSEEVDLNQVFEFEE